MCEIKNSPGVGDRQFQPQRFRIDTFIRAVAAQTEAFDLQTAQRFLQRFLERAPNRHCLADAFHPRRKRCVGLRKFFEREPRHFDDAVVDGWLEARRRLTRDIVFDFVERVTDGEFRCDFRDGETSRLRCQGARARHAWIHLDYDHPAVIGINSKLNVRAAGLDADLANDRKGGVAHHLVFFVRQRLCWRDCDRVPGVHAHRIEVLDRAHHDAVVRAVAHHLHLEFLPADKRFLDQRFMDG